MDFTASNTSYASIFKSELTSGSFDSSKNEVPPPHPLTMSFLAVNTFSGLLIITFAILSSICKDSSSSTSRIIPSENRCPMTNSFFICGLIIVVTKCLPLTKIDKGSSITTLSFDSVMRSPLSLVQLISFFIKLFF